jgi:hypothetical protein
MLFTDDLYEEDCLDPGEEIPEPDYDYEIVDPLDVHPRWL